MRSMSLVVLLVVASNALGEDQFVTSPETLHGHPRVAVSVVVQKNEYGIQAATFKAFILSSLQGAGVPATDKTETAFGWLNARLSVFPVHGVTVFSLDVTLEQPARLIVGEGICVATTWKHSQFGVLPEGGGVVVRRAIMETVAAFSKDWASAHKVAKTTK